MLINQIHHKHISILTKKILKLKYFIIVADRKQDKSKKNYWI